MSKTIEIAKELKQELDQLPLFQEYKKLREQVEASEEIAKLKEDIARASLAKDHKLHKELNTRSKYLSCTIVSFPCHISCCEKYRGANP